MVKLEDMEDVMTKKDHWEKFDALVEVAFVAGQQEEDEEREKKMREEMEKAVAFLSLAAKKRCKTVPRPYQQPNMEPPPEMPERFRRKIMEMGGENVAFVIEKMLFETDVSAGHNRLSMPMCQIRQDFVTKEERRRLDSTDANINGVEVILVEPSLEDDEVMLKKWKMKRNSILYVLIKNWNSVVKRNGLGAGDVVRVWSFRVGSKLGFALVRVGDEEHEGKKGKSTGKKKKDGVSGSGSKGKEVEDNGGNETWIH